MVVPPRPLSRFQEAIVAAAEKARLMEAQRAVREGEQKLKRAGDLLGMAIAGQGSREDLLKDVTTELSLTADLVGAVVEEIGR